MYKKLIDICIIALQIILLYGLSLLGDQIVQRLNLPFPGSIVGLLILLLLLHLKVIRVEYISKGAGFLLPLLTLFFIPATIGIIKYPELFTSFGLLLTFITVVSTLVTLGFTSMVAQKIEKNEKIDEGKEGDEADGHN